MKPGSRPETRRGQCLPHDRFARQLEQKAHSRAKFDDVRTRTRVGRPCVTNVGKDTPVLGETSFEASTDVTFAGARLAVPQATSAAKYVGSDREVAALDVDRIAKEDVPNDLSDYCVLLTAREPIAFHADTNVASQEVIDPDATTKAAIGGMVAE